ncbi:MAG: CoA transferase, partial [Chloroflexota bacterium]
MIPLPGPSLLAGFRVLDLTTEPGHLCGRVLGDMGADVIKLEPPGGDSARRHGPFYADVPGPERSLRWLAFNANKRSAVLDLNDPDDHAAFLALVAHADFVIESFAPGYLEGLGLSYGRLQQVNPRIIMTSITPFGQTGPYAGLAASDLTLQAMGGGVYVTGDPDRPPLQIPLPVAHYQACAEAAGATMLAHYHRQRSGAGQHVDVSMQEC